MLGIRRDLTKLQLANELTKDIKSESDLNALSRELLIITVETALLHHQSCVPWDFNSSPGQSCRSPQYCHHPAERRNKLKQIVKTLWGSANPTTPQLTRCISRRLSTNNPVPPARLVFHFGVASAQAPRGPKSRQWPGYTKLMLHSTQLH